MKKLLRTSLILVIISSLILLSVPTLSAGEVEPTWDSTLGWDFEDHGYTHAHFSRLTEEQIRIEEEAVEAAFLEQLYPPPRHIAYPYGDYDATVERVVSEYRDTGRMVWGQMMPYPVTNWYEMKAAQLKKTTPWKKIQAWVDECIETQSLLHIFTHDVSSSPSVYGCTTNMLTQLLDYVKQQQDSGHLQVMTMAEAYDHWVNASKGKAIVVISFDDANESDYTIVYPLFKERGLKGTSYITISFIGEPGHLTWANIDEMRSSVNQPPVAYAGEDKIVFDDDGDGVEVGLDGTESYDPDGEITSYKWEKDDELLYGDVSFNYTFSVGVHNVKLTVTDDDGATDTDEVVVTVVDPTTGNVLNVASIDMTLKTAGINTAATAVVTITDGSNPVSGATVSGRWSGATEGSVSGLTDAAGQVIFQSAYVKKASSGTTFTFTVTNVALADWIYTGGEVRRSASK